MKTRVLTSLYFVIVLILLFISRIVTPYIFDIGVGVLAVFGVLEIARTLQRIKKHSVISVVGLYPAILFIGLFLSFRYTTHWTYYIVYFASAFVLSIIVSFLVSIFTKKQNETEQIKNKTQKSNFAYSIHKSLNTAFLMIYPALLFASLFVLNHLNDFIFVTKNTSLNKPILSLFFLMIAFIITMATDTFAMLIGSAVKGPKMFPIISPNKTYSGAIGGLVGGTAAALLLYAIFSLNPTFVNLYSSFADIWFIVLLGFGGSVFCQVGDIFASYIKRKARVKDYGTIFPGHGGIMDRVDGLVFTSTFVTIAALIVLLI